ncbi:carbamoyl phosphate synthase-like protein [Actinomyces bovis]|uniref:Carbamoyl phosphate synthase-like protein n=1 Tax=Actinomyces bovis TaxID=1658 RepID=A0ABY1VRQ9_9ACTO|nr:hypothetical protein [Actinomyces bovis]SPT54102.1 carbamoyl phosphate synthase-like protein [Actinomyces bovis]VEG53671.1 carbamoyl phosphate synthase-like protein [Actinomyces israelii]
MTNQLFRRLLHPTPPAEHPDFGRNLAYTRSGKPFRLLLIGGDIGALSQARSFYEAYGVPASLISRAVTPYHTSSSMFHLRYDDVYTTPDGLVSFINEIAALDDSTLLVSTSQDPVIVNLTARRDDLASNVVIPYTTNELILTVGNKARFAELAQKAGIKQPRTMLMTGGSGKVPAVEALGYPLICKPANGDDLTEVGMEGQEKVFILASKAEVDDLVRRIDESGFTGEFLFQERIPGPDSQMRILTCYRDTQGKVRVASYGHSVVEEHEPLLRGNPAVILTGLDADELGKRISELLDSLDWVGYANFDIKVDPRDDSPNVFELNPRLGRSNYYLTVSGFNPVELMAEDWVGGDSEHVVTDTSRKGMYLVTPVVLALAYGHGARKHILQAVLTGRVRNPLIKVWPGAKCKDLRRAYHMSLSALNQLRRFHRYYPLSQARRERQDAL